MEDIKKSTSFRLKQIRDSKGFSQSEFANILGIPQTSYSNYEKGTSVSDKLLMGLAYFGINLNWFFTGNGSMFEEYSKPNMVEYNKETSYITPSGKTYSVEISDGGLSVPILASKVSAGYGTDWLPQDFKENERLPILKRFTQGYDIKRIFSAEVKGDSMMDINILDGDIVYAVHGETEGNGIYVIAVDGEVFVKRLEYDPFDKTIQIISENEKYKTRTVDPDRIVILGKVLGWLHRYPY